MPLTGMPGFMHGSVYSLGPTANASFTTTQCIRHSPRVFATMGSSAWGTLFQLSQLHLLKDLLQHTSFQFTKFAFLQNSV